MLGRVLLRPCASMAPAMSQTVAVVVAMGVCSGGSGQRIRRRHVLGRVRGSCARVSPRVPQRGSLSRPVLGDYQKVTVL